jgi:DNA polymerase-1
LFPDIEEMHTTDKHVRDWVEYSAFDAEITYFLRETLSFKLSAMRCNEEDLSTNFDLYIKYWLPFGEILTNMERIGFKVDTDHLKVNLLIH